MAGTQMPAAHVISALCTRLSHMTGPWESLHSPGVIDGAIQAAPGH